MFEKRERELVFVFASLTWVPKQLGANKNNSLCTAQFNSRRWYSRKERENWYIFLLLLPGYRYNSMQTRTVPCVLRNSVRGGGNREMRERTGIFFCLSYQRTDSTRCKQDQFPVCCAIQFEKVVVEKGEREMVFFFASLTCVSI